MTKDITLADQCKVLDDIIDNAIELPLDSQEVILLIAKSMRYTRKCMTEECNTE